MVFSPETTANPTQFCVAQIGACLSRFAFPALRQTLIPLGKAIPCAAPLIGLVLLATTLAGCSRGKGSQDLQTTQDAGIERPTAHAASTAEDQRDAFCGKWVGEYADLHDELVVRRGDDGLTVAIILHATFAKPVEVTGEIVDSTTIEVPEQLISGFHGTATLKLAGTRLELRQSGFGLTFNGHYLRSETE